MSDASKKAVLVTGGGTGIGAATATLLARQGYAVAVAGRRAGPLEAVAAAIRAAGGEVATVVADASTWEGAQAAVAATVEAFGGLDGLVVNHGVGGTPAPVGEMSLDEWDNVLAINLRGAFLVAKAALPHIVARRGSVVAVASNSAIQAGPGWPAYCTSKAGLVMLIKSIANDYGRQGVRANAVLPGFIVTEMADGAMYEVAAAWDTDLAGAYEIANRDLPLGRVGQPEEVAAAIAFLLGPAASFITGASLPLDGGATIMDPTATATIFGGPRR